MILPGAISVILGIIISKAIPSGGRALILLKCVLWAICYLLICALLYLNAYEKDYIKGTIKRMLRKEA